MTNIKEKTKELSKDERISAEERRLKRQFARIEPRKKQIVIGLVQRAAYMRVCLEDFEHNLDDNGFTEMFSQAEHQAPYERKRPIAEIYQNMNNSYQKIIKQLTDMLPREEPKPETTDPLDDFINAREDT